MSKMFNPHTYFKTREGLWVSAQFTSRVLMKQQPMMMLCRGIDGVVSNIVPQKMTYQEIVDKFLGSMTEIHSHAFTLDQIASLIDLQPNGKDGALLNNGHANFFYVLVDGILTIVDVGWSQSGHDWGVETWFFRGCTELENDQVFRNTILTL